MAADWEFNSSVFAVLRFFFAPTAAKTICTLVFLSAWLALLRRWFLGSPKTAVSLPPGEWIYALFLLLSSTANPWYALWLWPFVAVRPSPVGICALAAVQLSYVTGLNLGRLDLGNFAHPWWLRPIEFGSILVVAVWQWRSSRALEPRASKN